MNTYWKMVLVLGLYGTIISLELVVDKPLFQVSLSIVKYFSNSWDTNFAYFLRIYSNYGIWVFDILVICFLLQDGSKIKQIMALNTIYLTYALIIFLKSFYQAPRPYWLIPDIPLIQPEKDYGNPSGHTGITSIYVITSLYIYWTNCSDLSLNEKEQQIADVNKTKFFQYLPIKIIITAISLFLLILMIFSRIYLGCHGLNQLLYGFSIAILNLISVFVIFRVELISFYKSFLIDRGKASNFRIALLIILAFIIYALINLAVYFLMKDYGEATSQEIIKRMHDFGIIFNEITPIEKSLINNGWSCIPFGVHLGVLFAQSFYHIDPTRISLEASLWQRLIRFLIVFFIAIYIPEYVSTSIPSGVAVYSCWCKTYFPAAIMGFATFAFGDLIMDKCHLLPSLDKELLENVELNEVIS